MMDCIITKFHNATDEEMNIKGPKRGQMNLFCKTNLFRLPGDFKVHPFTQGPKSGLKWLIYAIFTTSIVFLVNM